MKLSTILAASGLAALTSAAPVDSDAGPYSSTLKGVFQIADFNWGCTVGCDWLFNVTIPYSGPNHRPVTQPAQCQGQRGAQKGYVDCTTTSSTQQVRAYVGKTNAKTGGSTLFLAYQSTYPKKGSYYTYYGNTTVYSQTGNEAGLQKKKFSMPETSATAVA